MKVIFYDHKKNDRERQLMEEIARKYRENDLARKAWAKVDFHDLIPNDKELIPDELGNSIVFIHSTNDNSDMLKSRVIELGGKVIWYSGASSIRENYESDQFIKVNYEYHILPYLGDFLGELEDTDQIDMKNLFQTLCMGKEDRQIFNRAMSFQKPIETLVQIYWLMAVAVDTPEALESIWREGILINLKNDIRSLRNNSQLKGSIYQLFEKIDSRPCSSLNDLFQTLLPRIVDNLLREQPIINENLASIRTFLEIFVTKIQEYVLKGKNGSGHESVRL